MISIILSGHGSFSTSLLEASQMIFGAQEQVIAVPFLKGEGIQNLQEKYKEVLKEIPEQNDVLFLVDLFGGTPYNAAAQLVAGQSNKEVAGGVSLPVLLEALGNRDNVSLSECTDILKEVSKESFQTLNDQLENINTNDNSEEDEL